MRFLRSNTAVLVTVGPFYDKTDGVTIETALTITNERITLTADTDAGSAPTNILDNVTGATSGTANDLNYITGNDAGMMQLELAAADTNRVGRMMLSITDAANHCPVFHEFFVLPQAIYDWLTGVIVPLPANTTHAAGTAWGSGAITADSIAADAITAAKIADGAIDAATLATGTITAAKFAAGAIDAAAIAADAITDAKVASDVTIASVTGAVGSVAGNVVGSVASVTGAVSLSAGDSPVLQSGTATAGAASTITIQTAIGADSLPVGCTIKVTSGTGLGQARVITAYVNATKVVTVDRAWTTNPDATSVYSILYTELTALGASLKVSGVVLVDTTSAVTGLTASNLDATISSRMATYTQPAGFLAATFPGGTIANTTNITAGTITTVTTVTTVTGLTASNLDATISSRLASASYTAPTNLTAAQIASGVWTDIVAGDFTVASSVGKSVMNGVSLGTGLTVAEVSGAVGSVTGSVGGNIAGSVASVSGNVGGNLVGTIGGLTAAALKDFFDTDATTTYASAVAGSVVKEIADNAGGGTPPTVAEIADAVWDEAISGHLALGSTGLALLSAGSAGDPWSTALPGAYGAGTAGKIVGDNINATVSSRLATAGYTAPTNLTAAQIASGVWTDTTAGDFTTALSVGKSLMNGISLGTGLTVVSVSGDVGGNVVGSVASVTAAIVLPTIPTSWITADGIATDAFGALELASGAASEIATAVRAELATELGRVDVAVSTRASQTSLDTLDDLVDTEVAALQAVVDAILVDTAEIGVAGAGLTNINLPNQTMDIIGNITGSLSGTVGSVTGLSVNAIADSVLSRSVSNVEGSAGEHTLCTVVLAMLENSISGSTLTIKRTDGSTTHVTKTLSTNAAAEPIVGIQ